MQVDINSGKSVADHTQKNKVQVWGKKSGTPNKHEEIPRKFMTLKQINFKYAWDICHLFEETVEENIP